MCKKTNAIFFMVSLINLSLIIKHKTNNTLLFRFCANKNSYREICNLFDMSESTFFRHTESILDFFHEISKEYIKMPMTDAEKANVANEFEKVYGFFIQ